VQYIVITSTKGGVGKTTIAVNMSILLGIAGRRVLILDMGEGGASSRLLNPEDIRASLAEFILGKASIVTSIAVPDIARVELRGEEIDMDLFVIPPSSPSTNPITLHTALSKAGADGLRRLWDNLSILRDYIDVIVVDLPTYYPVFNPIFALLDRGDRVLVVSTPDYACIDALSKFYYETLSKLLSTTPVVVLNMCYSKDAEIRYTKELKRIFTDSPIFTLPWDPSVRIPANPHNIKYILSRVSDRYLSSLVEMTLYLLRGGGSELER